MRRRRIGRAQHNPSNTEDVICEHTRANGCQAEAAIAAAKATFPAWRDAAPQARADILDHIGGEL
jgi:acyl-CoA reductase-like NAD-dependent aldehyde dehydrogenase